MRILGGVVVNPIHYDFIRTRENKQGEKYVLTLNQTHALFSHFTPLSRFSWLLVISFC